ncbi:MAG TPA: PmoA family protein [Bacteroidales bacterium]|nr:PmoA family protein [Bacteroidales bacterium]
MKRIFLFIFLASLFYHASAQKIATLMVSLEKSSAGMEIPVKMNLDEVTLLPDSSLVLTEISGKIKTEIPFQVEAGNPRILNWIVTPSKGNPGEKHIYELSQGKSLNRKLAQATVKDGILTLHKGSNNLLSYVFKTVYPPAGVDSSYRRSGFIHPLWSPGGKELTRIQPPDHYHHYGIWNPWTMVKYKGDTIDFWNINSKQGTVRFEGFVSVEEGPVYSEFSAVHEHVVFHKNGSEEVAMNELQTVRVYPQQNGQDYFIVDFNFRMNCATENPFNILEYRYAGLGWRTTEKWDRYNSIVLTSEGKTRKDADGSKARWCIVEGALDQDYAGVVMMSFPTNYNFPEPLRIWPENQYNRGDMFANFCPTKDMDWTLEPGKNYSLTYRFLVYNGKSDATKAENAWYYFANPPRVSITK